MNRRGFFGGLLALFGIGTVKAEVSSNPLDLKFHYGEKSFDARVWAQEFVKVVKKNPSISTDEGTMIGWFANAIMSGWDEAHRRLRPPVESCRAIHVASRVWCDQEMGDVVMDVNAAGEIACIIERVIQQQRKG